MYQDIQYATYREACQARGLLKDDTEWQQCLTEAALFQMPKEFRLLFAMIVRENSPTSPKNLFNQFKDELASDYRYNRNNTNGPYMESDYNEALWSIDDILRRQPPCTRFVKSNITTTSIK